MTASLKQPSASPLITIYMPTHNRLDNLKRALLSVQAQSYDNWELIIVNDGSSDGTKAFLDSIQSVQIRIFHNDKAKGACHARNIAIQAAQGEFITGLDDDDEFCPDRLETLIGAWQPQYSFLCTPVTICKGSAQKEHPFFIGPISLESMLVINKVGNQIFCKTEHLREIGGFDEEFKAWQDYDTWVRFIERFGPGLKLPKSTYLQHESSSVSITRSPNRLKGFYQFLAKHEHLMDQKQRNAMKCWEHIIKGQWVPLRVLAAADNAIFKYSFFHNIKRILGR
ncbi:glycosyltransferase [Pseudoalteromonas sp. CO348]|uniref:glycosyltransferase n=1 Tax=Pseudoalteromonas TaxID=53246 RepID=UPI001022ABDD|nr:MULTISPECIES: glycosyltransferase [Pseudoalteromonas]MCG7538929.1 glycosyltransferase [Pseudoalteromonas sp. OF7H-1]MCG9767320.1 glycosyltransferase [Pseudoalteromonas piscicida]QZO13453.1 glycosyltransferase [Pseudoalteromonas piscicida]RZG03167.1 glycosyltransferase [Pseudoalteromonas sp. CO348]